MLCMCSFHFWHFADILFLSATWNYLFCGCVHEVTIWWQMLNFVFISMKRWFQFNSRIIRTHFASVMTLNNWQMITETRRYIFRWRSHCRRPRVCVNSLLFKLPDPGANIYVQSLLKFPTWGVHVRSKSPPYPVVPPPSGITLIAALLKYSIKAWKQADVRGSFMLNHS